MDNNNLKPKSIGGVSFNEQPSVQQSYQPSYQSGGSMGQSSSQPPQRDNKWIIMCISLAVAVVILLIVLIVVIANKDDSSDDKKDDDEIETTADDDDDDDDDTEEDTEENTEEATTEVTTEANTEVPSDIGFEYIQPTEFSGQWTDFQVSINGTFYQFPFPYSVLEANGWNIDYTPDDVASADNIYVYAKSPVSDYEFTFYVTNPHSTIQPVEACFVTGFEVDEDCTQDVIMLSDNITFLSSYKDAFLEDFGAPDYAGEYDDGSTYIDYSTDDFDGYMDITFNTDGVFSCLYMDNCALPEGVVISQDISTEAPDINATYVAPTGPSTDIEDSIITVDGDYYKLPCPVSEFTKNGWEIESMTEETLTGGSMTYSAFERDGEKFFCMIRNFTDNTIFTYNGMVTLIDCVEGYCDGIEIVFPGSIKIGDLGSDFEALYGHMENYTCDKDDEFEDLSYNVYFPLDDNYYQYIYIWVDCDYDTGVITDYSYEYEGSPF